MPAGAPPPAEGTDELALNRTGARFLRDEVERDYLAWRFERSVPSRFTTVKASAVAWAAAFVLLVVFGHLYTALICVGVMAPVLLASQVALRRRSRAGVAIGLFAGNTAAGLLVVIVGLGYLPPEFHAAMLAAIVGALSYRFGSAHEHVAVSALSVGVYVLAAIGVLASRYLGSQLSLTAASFEVSILLLMFAMALLMARGAETGRRNAFRQERVIERQNETIARERARNEALLKRELQHQVAERSRELTEALARSEGSIAPASLDVGDVFDRRYRVSRALGRGGMGAVYEVERTSDGRRLALKVVTALLSSKHAARFAREAEIGARLQHENLVSIVDVGIAAGATPFLVMELVQGSSLEDKRARFGDSKWALPILRQIASGLAELHANSVVHRDLKPGNVLLVENDGVAPPVAKISDFGISRFGAVDDSADVDAEVATAVAQHASPRDLTETGALMGTPLYMPPEAWFGAARHPSADVFSFGVLAYEALTGRSPFAVPAVLLVRSRQPIPAPAPLDGMEAAVASLVLACLRVEPSDRPRAREIADRLERAAQERVK